MQDPNPELLEAMRRIFPTRDEVRSVLEYQQQLYRALDDLTKNHRAVHEHVRALTESHNRSQGDTSELMRTRDDISNALRTLDVSHRQTREDIRRAVDAITFIQQEVRKISQLSSRLDTLERDVRKIWDDDRQDDRKRDDQDRRIRTVEQRR